MVKNYYVTFWVMCTAILMNAFSAVWVYEAQASELGKTVTNIATVGYEVLGSEPITVLTNPASFVIDAKRTTSTIEFFRYSPNAPEAEVHQINGSDYSPSGSLTGPFVPVPNTLKTLKTVSRVTTKPKLPLSPASLFLNNELMFVCVVDAGQNGDPRKIETVSIIVQSKHQDTVTLRLYESGENTGEFWAYIPSSRDITSENDPMLTVVQGAEIRATYIDSYDSNDVSVDLAYVDPYSRVFNSLTGELVNEARVSLINAQTHEPALVFGVDGVSKFPSTMISGQSIIDASGLVYDMRPGEYRFPLVLPGEYYVKVTPPTGLVFASAVAKESFASLENFPFVIDGKASYGRNVTIANSGPLNFDIPLDGKANLSLTKTTSQVFGGIGDYISYQVTVENKGKVGAPVHLRDTLPQGFRYVAGTASLAGQKIIDPDISSTGQVLSFALGNLLAHEKMQLKYVAEIGAGAALGQAVNTIVAIDGNQANNSNIARARLRVREDLLRSTSAIVGRISQNSCDGSQEWAREINQGDGVEGVRIYMETGAYAISDANGLYHFEGVKLGTHVVQIDTETLPQGFVPMVCEENSQYAGAAISKFVDVQGGSMWRANFYLKRVGEVATQDKVVIFNDQLEYKKYDAKWLETQSDEVEWVYPSVSRTPSKPSVNIGIKHGPKQRLKLFLNGKAVPRENIGARESDAQRRVLISRWRSVDILSGENNFSVQVLDLNGNVTDTITRDIHYVSKISRATSVADQSILVADGRTKPVLAIRLEDDAGRAVHAGRIANIHVLSPYHLYDHALQEGAKDLVRPLSNDARVTVGPDGIARILLEPTLRTGKVTINIKLDDGREVTRYMQLIPEQREWIIVGLAEASAAHNSLKNKTIALEHGVQDGRTKDGRVAFFAKGLVKGNWLLTLAVDTDKRRGQRDGDFESEIDPNAYYTLYGDRSYNEFEAVSRYPVYVKLEKKTFYAMFGDFDPNITEGKLTHYNRHLSGFKSEYLGDSFQAIAYAAETNQGFAKDEIAANGTSGPYFLSQGKILSNSETIVVETRNRVRPDVIINTRRLSRHLDYTLDAFTGEVIFRLPVDVSDAEFNPNVIVVDYETSTDSERNISYGGRVQKQILNGKVQIGSTFVHEGGDGNGAGGKSDMVGAEIIAQVANGTEVRVEYALTKKNKTNIADIHKTSSAYLAEITHTSEKLTADAYFRHEDAGYGLKQRSSSTSAVRRYGVNTSYVFRELEDQKNGRRGRQIVTANIARQDNLGTGNTRTAGSVKVEHESDVFGLSTGIKQVTDNIVGAATRKSVLATLAARYELPKHGASVHISHEQPLSGNEAVSDYPGRTRIGLDKTLTSKASVHITHDILRGENAGGQNTALGISYAPWSGSQLTVGTTRVMSDSGRRIGATVGLDQQVNLNDKWSMSAGLSGRRILSTAGTINQITPDRAVSAFETNDSFSSVYLGLGYRVDKTSISSRVEARNGSASDIFIVNLAAAQEVSKKLSFAGLLRANWNTTHSNRDSTDVAANIGTTHRFDTRLGVSWRPHNEDLIFLNRLDLVVENHISKEGRTKIVNNFVANKQISDRWQISGNYGVKYAHTTIDGVDLSRFTHLIGGETRFDLTKKIDIGFHGSALLLPSTTSYTYGPSIGVSPVDNVWISLGYNISGYKDQDFSAAEYAYKGLYMKFRFKFSQDSAQNLLRYISPEKT